jgi:hypothetical protein
MMTFSPLAWQNATGSVIVLCARLTSSPPMTTSPTLTIATNDARDNLRSFMAIHLLAQAIPQESRRPAHAPRSPNMLASH